MNLFKNFSIGKKLTIVLILVSVIPLCIIVYGFYQLGKNKLTKQTIHTLEVQAKNATTTISHYIEYKLKHIYKLVNTSQLIRILKTDKQTRSEDVSGLQLLFEPDYALILISYLSCFWTGRGMSC